MPIGKPRHVILFCSIFRAIFWRLVIPVVKLTDQKPITRLNPFFEYQQQQYLLLVQEIAAIPSNNLGAKVTELEVLRSQILAAVDLLITGI
ncbi:CcdB family protein [Methylomonas paludis]|uniref:Toxin CcdB n=1 Tax=Methylomonas paludis TaxID=1173101 RepID=A0A975RAL4_9GAMM|nr:CcdB family protein [Methylomonas paludis]QWF72272.1 CcdB family protein [Methylomonas paludis]